jgi:hypothetical protein
MLADRTLPFGGRRSESLEPVACPRSTRWRVAMSRVGGIVVLVVASACASPDRAAGPTNGPYIAPRPEAFKGRVIGEGHCVDSV